MSLSTVIRNQGNEYFRQAVLCPRFSVQKSRELYEKALSCYHRAQQKAENPEEESSATKNIGKAAWRIAGIVKTLKLSHQTLMYYLHEAVKGLCAAFHRSEGCKPPEWRTEIQQTINSCLQEVIDACDATNNTDLKITELENLVSITTVDRALADLQVKLGMLYFQDGVTKLQDGDFRKCLSRMRDCYRPVEEAKRLCHRKEEFEDLLREAHLLEQDVFYHTCSASSIQARFQGNELLSKALQEQEDLDMALVFEVIDWFKQAVVLAREVEIEQEAIAESRLGFVYDSVLKMTYRAKGYFNHSFQLAESLKPRIFTSEAWYKDCINALHRYQAEVRARDEEEKAKVRAVFLEELSAELKDIKEHNTSAIALVRHVYCTYPPKDPSWMKPSDDDMAKWDELQLGSKEYKKFLIKALAVFHPDKVDEKAHGMKWKVLCEEVTKMITNYYENTKFAC